MTLLGALGFMLRQMFTEFSEIKNRMDDHVTHSALEHETQQREDNLKEIKDDLENRNKDADYRQAHGELQERVNDMTERMRKVEIRCAANHGIQE